MGTNKLNIDISARSEPINHHDIEVAVVKMEHNPTHEIEMNSILITPEKRAERETSRSQRRRIQKVFFQLPKTGKPWWKFEPFDSRDRFIQRWNLFMLMPLAVEVWVFPYRLALGVPSISSEMQLIVVEFAVDMMFLFDMLISLCTVVPVGPGRDRPLTTFRDISRQYFHTTFMTQMVPVFPYWVALFFATNQVQSTCRVPSDLSKISWACVMVDQSDEIHMWWLTSAGRVIPRLWRLVRDFKAMESNLEVTVRALQILKFAVMIFLTAHWVGCIFFFIAAYNSLDPTTWVFEMEYQLPFFQRFGSSTSIAYLLCIYKGFNALSNLEYILHCPNNFGEIFFGIVVMVIAMWLEGNVLGTLLNYMVEKDPVAEAHKKLLEELQQFVERKNLTTDLSARLFGHFEFQYQKAIENRASSSVRLPRSLAIKVSECKYREVLEKCTLRGEIFFGCDTQFLNALLMKLKVVFYMPNEEILKKDDLARELCFVLNGACHLIEDDKVKRIVRHDVPNMAPVIGELAFFFGIVQPMLVKARPDGDVQLLLLTREDANALFNSYPEQLTIINGNILHNFGLDRKGRDIAQGTDDDNADFQVLKKSIKDSIARQQYDTFTSLISAAKAGDVEMIRDLLRCGAEIDAVDYDGRSAFAMACYEGSFKVVELLLEEGVDKNTKNRWNKTPLDEALSNRQGPVVELLSQFHAITDPDHASAELRAAAAKGDLDQLRRLIDSKIDPDLGDYDSRTAMHLAASKKHIAVVEFLIQSKADVNPKDRWGGTPLQDAVSVGDEQLAFMLRGKGGFMDESLGASKVCDAALRGDVKTLNLLINCAGVKANHGDFDMRCPLHYAAMEARLLAVSFLLGIAADPDVKDRWGHTPIDLALRGGTQQHLYCARLIYGWGGEFKETCESDDESSVLQEMKKLTMGQVRLRIEFLLSKGYDKRVPVRMHEQSILEHHEASTKLIATLSNSELISSAQLLVHNTIVNLRSIFHFVGENLIPYLSAVPLEGVKPGFDLKDEFEQLLKTLSDGSIYQENSDGDLGYCAYDSEEEARLFEELDHLLETQERAELFNGNSLKFMANSFQKAFLRISELEHVFRKICDAFRVDLTGSGKEEPTITSQSDLLRGMELLSISEVNVYELQEIFEEGKSSYDHECRGRNKSGYDSAKIPLRYFIAGSEKLRSCLLALPSDPIYCSLLKTQLAMCVPNDLVKILSQDARLYEVTQSNKTIYSSVGGENVWFVVLSGKLRVHMMAASDEGKDQSFDVCEGGLFSGNAIYDEKCRSEQPSFHIKVADATKYIEMQGDILEQLRQDPDNRWQREIHKLMGSLSGAFALHPSGEGDQVGGSQVFSDSQPLGGSQNEAFGDSKIFKPLKSKLKDRFRWEESNTSIYARSIGKNLTAGNPVQESDRDDIKTGLKTIYNLWRDVSMGGDQVSSSLLSSICDNVGEIGSELFRKIFLNRSGPPQITVQEFWGLWMKFLSDEAFNVDCNKADSEELLGDEVASREGKVPEMSRHYYEDNVLGCFELIHSQYAPNRRLRQQFFSEQAMERYESSFTLVAGSLKTPIPKARIPEFLELLFPSYPYKISPYNVQETLEVFGRQGNKSQELFWADLRKGLRERKGTTTKADNILIRSALNPNSAFMIRWKLFIKLVAVYHFVFVPIRITFLPWTTMTDPTALCTDLIADVITILNFILLANTAYMSSRATWVTKRSKLIHKVHFGYALASLPLDWFAFVCGASNALSCWLRLPKLVLLYTVLSERTSKGSSSKEASGSRRLYGLACVVFGVLHIGACIWFYIGDQYAYWFPEQAISWYHVDDNLKDLSFTEHHKFGMEDGAPVWEQYTISFYWVAATFTSNGLTGDVIPSNVIEISFCIILMVLNLTLFRYITGEVSSIVMKSDEKIVKARAELEAVETLLLDKRIPRDLGENIRHHFRQSQNSSSLDQSALFSQMSHSLRLEVASATTREYLDDVELFRGCGEKLLDSIGVLLREVQFAPEEFLFRSGEVAHEMFFIVSGSVDELSERDKAGVEKVERTLNRGRSAGELSFFFGMRHLESARAHKLHGAVCLRLPRAEFLPLLKMFPDDEEKIAQAALKSFEVCKSQKSRSLKSGSARSPGHKSERSIGSKSKQSKKSSMHNSTSEDIELSGSASNKLSFDSESEDGVSVAMGGDETQQRVETLKTKRQNDRINFMLSAAAKGDLAGLKHALRGESVNISDLLKRTPLHVAASEGQIEIVRYLLDSGADIFAEDKFKNTCLNDALRHRHDPVIKLLRDRGAILVLNGNEAGVLMCQATFASNLDEVKRLIKCGVSPSAGDDNGRTALHVAASEGNESLVEYLLESKACSSSRDQFGGSPLDDAVRSGHKRIQDLLRLHGATLDVISSSSKMCDFAASGNVEAIKVMIDNGVDCSVGTSNNRTAAHLAASNGMISVLDYLISRGKEFYVNSVDFMGNTPLEDARRHGHQVAEVLLRSNGGILPSEPGIEQIKQMQETKLKIEEKARRDPKSKALIHGSDEFAGLQLIERTYIPAIQSTVLDLQSHADAMRISMEGAIPVLRNVLTLYGLLDFDSRIDSSGPESQNTRRRNKSFKVLNEVILKITGFAAAASSAIERFSEDLPRNRAILIIAKPFLREASALQRMLKASSEIVKITKKSLKETCALSKPSGNSKTKDHNQVETAPSFRAHRIAKRLASIHREPALTGICLSENGALILSPSSEPEDGCSQQIQDPSNDHKRSWDQTGNPEEAFISVQEASESASASCEDSSSPA